MSTVESPAVDNGVNVEALLGARQALAEAPEAAQFRWRARCEWVNGTHSRTTVHDFFGLGAEHTHRVAVRDRGRPPRGVRVRGPRCDAHRDGAGRTGRLPDGGHRGGRHEPRHPAALGERRGRGRPRHPRDPRRRPRRAQRVRRACGCATTIDADASRADIEAIVAQSQKRSAVYDILTNPTAVMVEVD